MNLAEGNALKADLAVPAPAGHLAANLPWWRQYRFLFGLQWADYQDSAAFMILFSIVMPLGLLWLLSSSLGSRPYEFLAGNAVIAIGFGGANFSINRVGVLRLQGEMDYYATLPIKKSAFAASLLSLSLVAALPGVLTSLFFGHWLLAIPWLNVATALPLTILAAGSLTIVGVMVGSFARTLGQINLYSNMVYVVVMFLSPVLAPIDTLPLPLRITSYILPTGQATMAITEALSGRFGGRFWMLVGLLALWLLAATTIGLRRLDWRRG